MKRRMIDPDFFTDSLVVSTLDYPGRLFYVGLWVAAEDSGVFEPDPFGLKMKIFPGDTISADEIAAYYDTLKSAGKIVEFLVDGKRYAWLRNFNKHQHLERPNPPSLPLPKCVKWYGKDELRDDNRRHWYYQVSTQCRHDDGTMTAICCPCDALKEVKGSKRKLKERKLEEVKGKEEKGIRASGADSEQPEAPLQEVPRLSDLAEANKRREELTRQLVAGEIDDEQFKQATARL